MTFLSRIAGDVAPRNVHAQANLFNRIKLFLPVQSPLQKYFAGAVGQIISTTPAVLSRQEGRFAVVINAGRDAVDVGCFFDERSRLRTAKPCGPDAPTLASSFAN